MTSISDLTELAELDPVVYSQVWGLSLRQTAEELDIDYDNLRKAATGKIAAGKPSRRIAALSHTIRILKGQTPPNPKLLQKQQLQLIA